MQSTRKLERIYYNPNKNNRLFLHHSAKALQKELNRVNEEIGGKKTKREQIKAITDFLNQQRSYTLYKNPTFRNTNRNPYRPYAIDQLWETDLASLPQLARFNDGFIYLLVCIDAFSRYAFVRPLRTKQPREVIKAFNDIFLTAQRQPTLLQSDHGSEYKSSDFQHFLAKQGIRFRFVLSTTNSKANLAEALNRILKKQIFRYLVYRKLTNQQNENRYIDALQMIVDDYNHSIHSRLGVRPSDVNKENSASLYNIQRGKFEKRYKSKATTKLKLQEGDFVRVKRKRKTFEKGYLIPLWSEEIFRINRIIRRFPFPVFEVIDMNGKVIDGKLYEGEIQKILLPSDTPLKITRRPNIFDRKKLYEVQSIDGKTRQIDLEGELDQKTNNYFDYITKLVQIKSKKK